MSESIRGLLVRWQFWALEIQCLLVVVTTLAACRSMRWRPAIGLPAVAIVASAWILTATMPPRTNRIFYDEHIYQGVAHSMGDMRLTQMCNEGIIEYGRLRCLRGEFNKEPAGYPYVLSLLYRIAGVREEWAPRLNNVAAASAALVAMGLTALLFERVVATSLAGIVMLLLPMQLTWSNTAAAEPSAAAATGVAVLLAVAFARIRTTSLLAATAAMTVFATNFRPESVLAAPLVATVIVLLAPDELLRRRAWIVALLAMVLMMPTVAHLSAVRHEGWGAQDARWSWEFAARNLPVNLGFYFADARFPTVVGIAAVIGLLGRNRRRERIVLLLYFSTFWTVFLFFYAGSYNYGADVRYSLLSYIPVAVLAGIGFETVAFGLAGRIRQRFPYAAVVTTTIACLVLQFLWYTPLVRDVGEEAWAARADVHYARRWASALPRNAIVLTHNPSMFLLWGVNAAQLSIAVSEPSYIRSQLFARYGGGVYVHWNFWCNVADPVQVALCEKALALFPSEAIDTRRERDYRFALYRLREP